MNRLDARLGVWATLAIWLILAPWRDAVGALDVDAVMRSSLARYSDKAASMKSLTVAQRRVDPQIRPLVWGELRLPPRPGPVALTAASPSWRQGGRVRVIVEVDGSAWHLTARLRAAGLAPEVVNERFGLVQGSVADSAVGLLAALDSVRSIRPAWPPIHSTGSVTSQGDVGSNAEQARARFGVDGTGITVGVISDGIDNLAASQASEDLPAVTVPADARCQAGTGDEGTAMLEIVHDLAPGSNLLFSGPTTSLEMIQSIECLSAAGADVIVDDLFFLGEPYFEDGPIAQAAASAIASGVSYHSAAGNYGDGRYLADEYRTGPDGFHDFDPGPGVDTFNRVAVPPGEELLCVLQWADPFDGASNDYDLYLVDGNGVVATSLDIQDGTQDPIEFLSVVNRSQYLAEAALAVRLSRGAERPFKLICPSNVPLQYRSTRFGIVGHAARPDVIAVGAIDAHDPGLDDTEEFSSQGPASVFFPTPQVRPKPDLVALDGVITTAPGFARFLGTSAAAPHCAAVAALLLDVSPNLTPADVQAVLTATAIDIEAPGFDEIAGFGRLDALSALSYLATPPTTTSTTAASTTTTSTTTTSTTAAPTTTTSTTATSTTAAPTTTTSTTATSTTAASTTTTSTTTTTNATTPPTTTTSTTLRNSTSTTVTPSTTTSTIATLCTGACDDGDPCTLGDECRDGQCASGSRLTLASSSSEMRALISAASEACVGGKTRIVRRVTKPLQTTAVQWARAHFSDREKVAARHARNAERGVQRATTALAARSWRLPSMCVDALEAAIAMGETGMNCVGRPPATPPTTTRPPGTIPTTTTSLRPTTTIQTTTTTSTTSTTIRLTTTTSTTSTTTVPPISNMRGNYHLRGYVTSDPCELQGRGSYVSLPFSVTQQAGTSLSGTIGATPRAGSGRILSDGGWGLSPGWYADSSGCSFRSTVVAVSTRLPAAGGWEFQGSCPGLSCTVLVEGTVSRD